MMEEERRRLIQEERRKLIQEEMLRRQAANVHRVPSHFEAPSRLRSSVYERDPSPLRARDSSPTTAERAISPEERAPTPAERALTPEERVPTPAERAPTPAEPTATPLTSTPAEPTEAEESAASTLQTHYRTRLALRSIHSIIHSFHLLKSSFSFPASLDFQSSPSSSTSSSPTPKLAYTPRNTPLHAYTEALAKLLLQLDGVESYGVRRVREARKAVVMGVEGELERVEREVGSVWERMQRAAQSEVPRAVDDAQTAEVPVDATESGKEESMILDAPKEVPRAVDDAQTDEVPVDVTDSGEEESMFFDAPNGEEAQQPPVPMDAEDSQASRAVDDAQTAEVPIDASESGEEESMFLDVPNGEEAQQPPVSMDAEDSQASVPTAASTAPAPEPTDEEEVWEMITPEDAVAPTATPSQPDAETQPAPESMECDEQSVDLDGDLLPSPILDSTSVASDFDATAMQTEPVPVATSAPVVVPVSV